jgi:hypothetical protein
MSDMLGVPHLADYVSNLFATARAVYGDDAPRWVWDAVKAAADRHFDDTIRVLIRSGSSATLPLIIAPHGEDREAVIAEYITTQVDRKRIHPSKVTVRSVASFTGIRRATVGRSRTWHAFTTWRRAQEGKGEIRTRELTDAMLAVVADTACLDPSEIAAEKEIAELSEVKRAELRAQLERDQKDDQARDDHAERQRRRGR